MNGIACMGGWCTDRDRCAHHHNTNGTPVFERLCKPERSESFVSVLIDRQQPQATDAMEGSMTFIQGTKLYARILGEIYREPSTVRDLTESLGVSDNSVELLLRNLSRNGMAYIAGERRVFNNRAAVWAGGAGVNAVERSLHGKPPLQMTVFISAIRALGEQKSARELAEELGIREDSSARLLKQMHAARLVCIDGWRRQPDGPPVRLFKFAPGMSDKARPQRKTRQQIEAERTKRIKATRVERMDGSFGLLAANFFNAKEAA